MRFLPLEVRWAFNRGWAFAWKALWYRVVRRRIEVHYSLAGDMFYVSSAKPRATFWMSVQTYSDFAPEVKKAKESSWPSGGFRFEGHDASFKKRWWPSVGTKWKGTEYSYNRLTWPFAFWKVKSGEMRFEPKSLPHVRDYLDCVSSRSTGKEEGSP